MQNMLDRDAGCKPTGVIGSDGACWGGKWREQPPSRRPPNKQPFPARRRKTADCCPLALRLSGGATSLAMEDFRRLCAVLGNLEKALRGTYHKPSPEHPPRSLANACCRSERCFDLAAMPPRQYYAAARALPDALPAARVG